MAPDPDELRAHAESLLKAASIAFDAAKAFKAAGEDYLKSAEAIQSAGRSLKRPIRPITHTEPKKIGIRRAIRKTLKIKPEGITLQDVVDFIRRKYPQQVIDRRGVTLQLSRMNKKTGELRIVKPGSGRTGATYAKARVDDFFNP